MPCGGLGAGPERTSASKKASVGLTESSIPDSHSKGIGQQTAQTLPLQLMDECSSHKLYAGTHATTTKGPNPATEAQEKGLRLECPAKHGKRRLFAEGVWTPPRRHRFLPESACDSWLHLHRLSLGPTKNIEVG